MSDLTDSRTPPEGPALNPLVATLAALLATAGAGWVIGGVFGSGLARLSAIGGALLGAAVVALSYRTSRPGVIQLLVIPAALVMGALLVLPETDGDLGEVPGFVRDAFEDGGLSTPPVPFDPGWRVIVVLLCAVLVAAAASLAVSFTMAHFAVAVPLVVVMGGMLVQPDRGETTTALGALVFVLAGLGVSFGAQLGRDGATSGRFEFRRLARGGVVVAVLAVGLAGVSQVGFLFPESSGDDVIEPRRPGVAADDVSGAVFTVREPKESDHIWRTGVLDVYGIDEGAWLTPPYDPDRFVELPESGAVPGDSDGGDAETYTAEVTIADGGGRALPVSGNATALAGTPAEYDPRTQTFQAAGRLADGTTYTITSPLVDPKSVTPSGDMAAFLEAPPVPPLVRQLLLTAPQDSVTERLEFARSKLYENVVSQGSGDPVDVSAERAQEIIVQKGTKATPYEIAAADALLARWVGVPARIGYGYYTAGKKADQDGVVEVRPQDAAMWLETHQEGAGWMPALKSPTRTPPPTDEAPQSERPDVSASGDRALLVYVPTRVQTVRLAYELIGYWALVTLPWVIGALLVWMWYPAMLKQLRRGRRRRWAIARDFRARIAVAYSDFRDVADDFGIGHPTQTPIEFLDAVDPDAEHRELAWLVTRALWGDLARGLREEDAEIAEDLARSLRKRLARAQPPPLRMFAGISRVSLKDPYSNEIPNLWPRRRHPLRALASTFRGSGRPPRAVLRRTATSGTAVIAAVFFLAGGCSDVFVGGGSADPAQASQPKVPEKIQEYVLLRSPSAERVYDELTEESLVTDGRVYEMYAGSVRQALLQIAWLKTGIDDPDEAKRDILASIETGEFTFSRIGEERAYVKQLPDVKFIVWFAPGDRYYQLFTARKDFPMQDLERVLKGLLAFQRDDRHQIVNVPQAPTLPDPRLGIPG